jgi:predicted porin
MKKTLLAAAAIVAFAGAAHAQSSVTIYGKVDLGLVLDSGNAAGKSVRVSSGVTGGSRLGFKGVEDLGGGMKASFQLETGICADSAAGAPNFCTGNNQFMGRQAHGDLAGAFGLLTAGRVYSFDFVNQTTADPFGTGYAGDSQNLFGDKSTSRLNNTVQYTTPSFSGLTASAEIAFGETTGNWEAGRETGAAVTYVQGPAYVSFTFLDVGNANGQGAARKNYELGATYDFGVVKLHGLVEKSTGNPTGVARPLDALDLLAGVTVPLAGGNVLAIAMRSSSPWATTIRCRSARRSTPRSHASRTSTARRSPWAMRPRPARATRASTSAWSTTSDRFLPGCPRSRADPLLDPARAAGSVMSWA